MQDLTALQAAHLPIKLPIAPQLPFISTATDPPTLYTVARTDLSTLSISSVSFPPGAVSPVSVAIHTPTPTSPSGLTIFEDRILFSLRTGELYDVDFSTRTANIIGDVTDADQDRAGVLALSTSPDSNLIAIISPLSLTLLDTAFSTVGHISHPKLATHAAIAWRSDGEFLAYTIRTSVSSVLGFVVDRACCTVSALDIDSDLSRNLATVIDWEPRVGGRIAIAGPSSAVTFFERNGQRLRRNDFNIVAYGTPKLLSWSPDSRLLAVASEEREDQAEGDCFRVAFYHHFNYKWYCKKRYVFQHRVVAILWDPDEIGLVTIVTEHEVFSLTLFHSPPVVSISSSMAVAAVVNGSHVELTDYVQARLPPSICHTFVSCAEDVIAISPLRDGGGLCILMADGSLDWCLFDQDSWSSVRPGILSTASILPRHGRKSVLLNNQNAISASELRFSIMPSRSCVVVVAPSEPWNQCLKSRPGDSLYLLPLPSVMDEDCDLGRYTVEGQVTAITHAFQTMAIIISVNDGSLRRIAIDEISGCLMEESCVTGLSSKVIQIHEVELTSHRAACFSLDTEGKLDVVEMTTSRKLSLSKECTSFCVHEGFLLFTTRSHLLYCMALDSEHSLANETNRESIPSILDTLDMTDNAVQMPEGKGATRPIDRGSIIITPVPGKTDIVLLAPRGNIESISPRPIVFEIIDRLAKQRKYGSAFRLCRTQRVDMNHIVEADFHGFLQSVAQFVTQVGNVASLSEFLTLLKGEKARINSVCDAVVRELKQLPESEKFMTAIMTGLVRRDPPNIIGALTEVQKARSRSIEAAQSAIDFLFILVKDEAKLYAEALGTYDLDLAAFVADSSRMDPMEYSQELHFLRATEENERKYKIDVKLQRHDSALKHLYLCGESRYDECIAFCHSHMLYEIALPMFSSDEKRRANLLKGYGANLRNTGKYDAGAAVGLLTEDLHLAYECYKLGSRWELALSIVGRRKDVSDEEKREIYTELADELAEKGQMVECAQIRVTKLGDLAGAVTAAASVDEWDAAFEAISTYAALKKDEFDERMSKGWDLVTESVLEGKDNLVATIRENRSKLRERGNRLNVLREAARKLREDMTSGGHLAGAESDAFSATSASSIGSNLSDVTFTSKASATSLFATSSSSQLNGPLSSARLEKQALKRQQRASKKRIREGHPKEAEYLPGYLVKLVPSDFLKGRVDKTVRALIAIGKTKAALGLLEDMKKLIDEAVLLPDDVVSEKEKTQLMDNPRWDEIGQTLSAVSQTET